MEKRKTKYSIMSSTISIGYSLRNEGFSQQKAQTKMCKPKYIYRRGNLFIHFFVVTLILHW